MLLLIWFALVGYGIEGCEEPCGALGGFTGDNETLVFMLCFVVASALVWVSARLWRR